MSDDTRRLTRCLTFIKENTSQVEKILDRLIEDEVLGLDERAQILSSPLLENQLHSIIETVIRKHAHQSFLKALKSTGNNHVVDRITEIQTSTEQKMMDREKTYTVNKQDDDDNVEKFHEDQFLKEKTLEDLKSENDRLKSQQSKVREQLNEKHKKIQELKLEIQMYKRQNTEMNQKIISFEELQCKMQDIEQELQNKDQTNKIIEIALCEKSEEIYRLQRECEDLRSENEEKSHQILCLSQQMESLKIELEKASDDRQRLEQKVVEMSTTLDDKFRDMMGMLEDLKGHRQAQCEVTTPRHQQNGRKFQQYSFAKSKYNPNNGRSKR